MTGADGRLYKAAPRRRACVEPLTELLEYHQRKEAGVKSHFVGGGSGTRLHVLEAGNPAGRPILFIHGFSQCCLAWSRQMNSDLARDHRLVALDLRGHGASEKPRDAYGDSRLWAEDIDAVVRELALEQPILSGWSYGPLLILDYLRHFGEEAIGGIHFVGGISRLGDEAALSVLTPEFLSLVPGLLSNEAEVSVGALDGLVRLCFLEELSSADRYLMLGYSAAVPAHVRQALFSRSLANDDVLRGIRKPVLMTHGTDESIVTRLAVDQHKALVPHAEIQMMSRTAHAPFWEDAPTFNHRLQAFAASV